MNVLVAYATKHHSTAEIAEVIGEVLAKASADVDVLPVESVHDLSRYDAVVLGSAVYMGQWQQSAADFLKQHERELSNKQVWLFSSGPTAVGHPKALTNGWAFPEPLREVADRINPRDIALFHGRLNPNQLSRFQRFIVRIVRAPAGDFRDWNMIRGWAKGIAQAV